jgi:uncharacterized protein (DUF1697 family)
MALVVFLRGVNVGGHKKLQPSILAKDLVEFDVVNVGAAGTFVIRKEVSQTALRDELMRRLPFKAELMICRASDLIDLARGDPFEDEGSHEDARRFVSVLAKRPRLQPPLPLSRPPGDKWEVKIIGVRGRFALSLWRRQGRTIIYPNEVVERNFGMPATTRNWNTISVINEILKGTE